MPSATKAPTKFYAIPAGTKAARCNGARCGKVIYFVTNPASGRMMPIDCDVDGGKRPSEAKEKGQLDLLTTKETPVHPGRGVSHFTNCPDAGQFTRKV